MAETGPTWAGCWNVVCSTYPDSGPVWRHVGVSAVRTSSRAVPSCFQELTRSFGFVSSAVLCAFYSLSWFRRRLLSCRGTKPSSSWSPKGNISKSTAMWSSEHFHVCVDVSGFSNQEKPQRRATAAEWEGLEQKVALKDKVSTCVTRTNQTRWDQTRPDSMR